MSYQLVIAEKPSVARSIAGVIGADKKQDGYMEGNGYLVSWCIGHLVSLADAGTYDERFKKWRYDDLPILPQEWQYIIPDDKKKQFDTLRSLMERPDVIAAGKKMTGIVGYEVPKDWKEIEIRFTPDFWSGNEITFIADK